MRLAPDPRDHGEEYTNVNHGGSVPKRPTTHFNQLDAVNVPQTQPGHPRDPVVHTEHSGPHPQDPHELIKQLQEQLATARAEAAHQTSLAAHHAREAETHRAALENHKARFGQGHSSVAHHPQGHGHADHHLHHQGTATDHPHNHGSHESDDDSALGDELSPDRQNALHHVGPQQHSGTHSSPHHGLHTLHGEDPAHLIAKLASLEHKTAILKDRLKKQEIEADHWHHEADKLKEQLIHKRNHGHGYGEQLSDDEEYVDDDDDYAHHGPTHPQHHR